MTGAGPILFVTHEGTRTGAPMMLLHFLRWLAGNSTVEAEIAIIRDGPLVPEFEALGPTTVISDQHDWPFLTRTERSLDARGFHDLSRRLQGRRFRREIRPLTDARTVYLNSSASLRLLHHLPRAQTSIAHIHELRSALRWSLRPGDAELLTGRVDHVVAAADCVAENLVTHTGVAPDAVTRIYEFIDTERVVAESQFDRGAVRRELGIPEDASIIGGSGFADWRKGIDLFVQMADRVSARGRDDIHFVWVGDRAGGLEAEQLDLDVELMGLERNLHLVGLQDRPFDWYRSFDLFALTSREDPYPLVGLETGLLEVPMLCFDRSGGMTELVRRSDRLRGGPSGVIVPYLDVEAMADAAIALVDAPDERAAMGARVAETVRSEHEVSVAGPLLLDVIERTTSRSFR